MKEFVLVISMWGNTGSEWLFIGNQSVMKHTFNEIQCQQLADENMWDHHNNNEYYKVLIQCYPACVAKEECL